MVTMSQSEIAVTIRQSMEASIRVLDVHKYYDLAPGIPGDGNGAND